MSGLHKLLLFVACILTLSPHAWSASNPPTQSQNDPSPDLIERTLRTFDAQMEIRRLENEIALASSKDDVKREAIAKDMAVLSLQASNIEKFVDKQDRNIDRAIATFGIILTVATLVLGALGLLGFITVKARVTEETREVARSEASAATEKWFQDQASDISKTIAKLSEDLIETKNRAETLFAARATEIENFAQQARTSIQSRLADDAESTPISTEASLALAESAHAAEAKPAELRNFGDWNTSAFEALRNNDFPRAILAWTEAANSTDAEEHRRAGALFNAALTQHKYGDPAESIRIADELTSKFGESSDPRTKVQVAKARVTKANSLSKMGRSDDSINENLNVVENFDQDSHPDMPERIVNARTNAAIQMAQAGRFQQAKEQIAKLSASSKTSKALFMRRSLAKSMCTLSSAFLQAEDWDECLIIANEIEARFGKDEDNEVQDWNSAALIIGSVCLYANGDISSAISRLPNGFKALKKDSNKNALFEAFAACNHLARIMKEDHNYTSALLLYDQLLEATEESTWPDAKELRPTILAAKSHSLIRNAKIIWSNPEARHENLATAKDCLEESLRISPDSSLATAHLAYATHLLGGEASPVSTLLRSSLETGGATVASHLREEIEFRRNDRDLMFIEILDEETRKA